MFLRCGSIGSSTYDRAGVGVRVTVEVLAKDDEVEWMGGYKWVKGLFFLEKKGVS